MSDERSELDLAIDALRDDVEPSADGGIATEAAIRIAVSAPRPPWWMSSWSIGGGIGLAALALGAALIAYLMTRPRADAPTRETPVREAIPAEAPDADADARPTEADERRDESQSIEAHDARPLDAAPSRRTPAIRHRDSVPDA